ncbi:MAG: hypothetical protein MUF36_09885 [Bacteroidales bacterium]|jgi:hypothetical protein|nr:hypothetical protein [Bacteroidales bacterium]
MKKLLEIVGFLLIIIFSNSCKKDEDKSITDGDGNVYTSVKIGTQDWLTENLKTTRYSNGEVISSGIYVQGNDEVAIQSAV